MELHDDRASGTTAADYLTLGPIFIALGLGTIPAAIPYHDATGWGAVIVILTIAGLAVFLGALCLAVGGSAYLLELEAEMEADAEREHVESGR